MSNRIALIAGVDKYDHIDDLPGCINDITAVKKLLTNIESFDEVLVIENNTGSIPFKERITSFFQRYRNTEVDELFFYFTGHGDFYNDEFYYLLSDYKSLNRQQTSLQNSELDGLIKSINPRLVVKIIDACKSGVNYIKDSETLNTYVKASSEKFENCYFLHSSLSNQSSYQNDHLSYFTQSILESIAFFKGNDIRYKDIIDYVLDYFNNINGQTPHFVIQAKLTEKFCTLSDRIRSELNNILEIKGINIQENEEEIIEEDSDDSKKETIVERVEKLSAQYKNREYVHNLLENISEKVKNMNLGKELEELYSLEVLRSDYVTDDWINKKLAKELVNRSKKDDYFFELEFETEEYEDFAATGILESFYGLNRRPIIKTRKIVSGFRLTGSYPFKEIRIEFESKYPALKDYCMRINFVTSMKSLILCSTLIPYRMKDFDSKELGSNSSWDIYELPLSNKDEILKIIDKSIITSLAFIKNRVNTELG